RVAGPVVPSGELFDNASVDGTVWTVGYASDGHGANLTYVARVCPISVADGGFFPAGVQFPFWTRSFWSISATSSQDHSITDGSGMGLFDSGLRSPGASFDFPFDVAGTYAIADSGSSNTSSVSVPIAISPKQGGLTTTFHVLWATYYAQPGFIYDVQI